MGNQDFYRGPANGYQGSIESIEAEVRALKRHLKKMSREEKRHSSKRDQKESPQEDCETDDEILPENQLFLEVLGEEILITMDSDQYNLFGQTFRPIFCGKVVDVTNGFITLNPVIIKMQNVPFHRFPIPLSFAIEQISNFTPFDSNTQFPIP
ncbi:hypothetical protein [Priestia flexa]|uniref:hypothetical protein n=1 Tax=Priestia flexa TaxID=86664 RepID=UPI00095486D3|nr:hypothetical protein [Priestia flexa]SIQ65789.1 hypothetical protein SAMN05880580_107129 [Priestia flexa]